MNSHKVRLLAGFFVVTLLLVLVAPLYAATASNFHWTSVNLNPDCGGAAAVEFSYIGATTNYELRLGVYGDGNLINTGATSFSLSGDGAQAHTWIFGGGPGPYSTCGVTHDLYIDGEYMGSIAYGDTPFTTTNTPWFYTQPSVGDLVTGNHQTVLYNGAEACGVFNAGWYGRKYIMPENFPACADYLPDQVEVACMNDEAEWTTGNVTGSGISEGVFYAVVEQHGTCGIFPAD